MDKGNLSEDRPISEVSNEQDSLMNDDEGSDSSLSVLSDEEGERTKRNKQQAYVPKLVFDGEQSLMSSTGEQIY